VHFEDQVEIMGVPPLVSEKWLFKIWQGNFHKGKDGKGPWEARDGVRY